MARQAVGIEMNEQCIRIVALRRARRGAAVEAFATVDHEGAIGTAGVVDAPRYLDALDKALKAAGAGRANLCIAFAYQEVDVRELEFPVMPERDLEHTIRFELSNVVRTGAGQDGDLVFDYAPLPGDQQHGKRRLLSIAAPRRIVRSFLDPLYAADIYPEIVEIGAFSLPWSCPREGGVCYLHANANGAQVLIFEAREFRVARQVGVDLSSLIGAARLRRTGTAVEDDAAAVLAFEELSVAVERTLEYHRARRRVSMISDVIDGLVVSGELGADPRFTHDLGRRLGVPATPADPIIGPGDAHVFGDEAPLYAVAAGMGVRGLNKL